MAREGDAAWGGSRGTKAPPATWALALVILITACGTPAESGSPGASPTAAPETTASASVESAEPSATPVAVVGGTARPGDMAYSDSRTFNDDSWDFFAQAAELQICSTPPVTLEPMDLEAAIGNARAHLDDGAGSGAMAALEDSPEGASAETATAAAAAALVDGNDAGALAALLVAAGLEPDDPQHLVNAAGLLPAFGLGAEALAFLDAADGMEELTSSPYGIDAQAAALNNRGRALLALGQWADAEALLREAGELNPGLSEAVANLSLAVLCQGNRDEAMRLARASRYRKPMRFVERESTSTPVSEDAFDLSGGLEAPEGLVPTVRLPETPEQGVAQWDQLRELKAELQQRFIDEAGRMAELQVASFRPDKPAITQTRESDILLHLSGLSAPGGAVESEWQAVVAPLERASAILNEHFGTSGTVELLSNECAASGDYGGCMQAECVPATQAAHEAWIAEVSELDTAVRAWADAYYPIATAIAAHVGDPDQYEITMITIRQQLDQGFLNVVTSAEGFAGFEARSQDTCVRAPEPPPDEATDLTQASGGDPCSVPTGAISIKVAFVSISVNCSDWSVEAATPGAIGVFAQISSTNGEVTVFVGPTASTGIGPFEGSTKGGFYVTVSETAGVRDFGYRVEPGSVSVGAGPVSVTAASVESMDFSFVGIMAYMPGM
jgi:tetratricopeptide (TPR) repeat protein